MSGLDVERCVNNFAARVDNVLLSASETVVMPQFYLTRHCNLKCTGCYMHANPSIAPTMIPSPDISFYTNEFKNIKNSLGAVTFSGGEIFTLPTEYLAYNIQNVLDKGFALELKTNGAWVDTPQANQIFKMLAGLRVPTKRLITVKEIKDFLAALSWEIGLEIWRDGLRRCLARKFPGMPALSVAMSVDDKIHPERSADWWTKFLHCVTTDSQLASRMNLNSFSFVDSLDFFTKNVLNFRGITDICHDAAHLTIRYKLNGREIESYFGDFVDLKTDVSPESMGNIGLNVDENTKMVVYYFWPDRTASFTTEELRVAGRVPYVDARGNCKDFKTLRREMALRLIDDYRARISR